MTSETADTRALLAEQDEKAAEQLARQRVAEMVFEVKKALDGDSYAPPLLPEVAISLQQLSGQSHVDIGRVEEVVTRDPTVAARVLSVANSVRFNRGTAVTSLRRAIMRLGLSEIRNIGLDHEPGHFDYTCLRRPVFE